MSDAKLRTGWVENGWHCSLSPGSMLQEAGNAHLSFLFLACSTFRGLSAAGWQFFPKALPLTIEVSSSACYTRHRGYGKLS